jgi:gamma-glutamyltranspeptidase/glutathione hydrolase
VAKGIKDFTALLALFIIIIVYIYHVNSNETNEPYVAEQKEETVSSEGYGVSASHPLAVKIGMEVLENGGNAVDAAVAVSLVLGVVEPYGSGIGGGGSMVVLPSVGVEPVMYDYRELSPLSGQSKNYIGVPGLIKGLEEVHKDFGTVAIDKLISPSIKIAEEGFLVDSMLEGRLAAARYRINESLAPNFFPGGSPIRARELLIQENLAKTLRTLKNNGLNDFYNGDLSSKVANTNSSISIDDLKSYSVEKTAPVKGEFKNYSVYSATAPMSGITLIQTLQMAELLNVQRADLETEEYIHLLGEISKRTYQDRLINIGDPNFKNINTEYLTSKEYSSLLASDISSKISDKFNMIDDSPADIADHSNTTHFAVMDKSGMTVSATNTLSNFFGSGVMVEGFFMNNQLQNFGTIPGSANYHEPGKRPRSFIAPTILVSKEEDKVIAIGTPGGRRIPMMIAEVLIQSEYFTETMQEAIDLPRFFVEDNKIYLESDISESIKVKLRERGYSIVLHESGTFYGNIQSLTKNYKKNRIYGGADQRRNGNWSTGSKDFD